MSQTLVIIESLEFNLFGWMVSQINSNLSISILIKPYLVFILAPLALSQGSGTSQVVSELKVSTLWLLGLLWSFKLPCKHEFALNSLDECTLI